MINGQISIIFKIKHIIPEKLFNSIKPRPKISKTLQILTSFGRQRIPTTGVWSLMCAYTNGWNETQTLLCSKRCLHTNPRLWNKQKTEINQADTDSWQHNPKVNPFHRGIPRQNLPVLEDRESQLLVSGASFVHTPMDAMKHNPSL